LGTLSLVFFGCCPKRMKPTAECWPPVPQATPRGTVIVACLLRQWNNSDVQNVAELRHNALVKP